MKLMVTSVMPSTVTSTASTRTRPDDCDPVTGRLVKAPAESDTVEPRTVGCSGTATRLVGGTCVTGGQARAVGALVGPGTVVGVGAAVVLLGAAVVLVVVVVVGTHTSALQFFGCSTRMARVPVVVAPAPSFQDR